MGNQIQNIMLAAIVIVLCVTSVLVGYMFFILTDDGDDRSYSIDPSCTVDGEEHPVFGDMTFEEYEESGNSRVYSFSVDATWQDASGADRSVSGRADIILDRDSDEPTAGYYMYSGSDADGNPRWSSSSCIFSLSGETVIDISILCDGVWISAHLDS